MCEKDIEDSEIIRVQVRCLRRARENLMTKLDCAIQDEIKNLQKYCKHIRGNGDAYSDGVCIYCGYKM